jgi:Ca2+-binding RTX toxin-like protein
MMITHIVEIFKQIFATTAQPRRANHNGSLRRNLSRSVRSHSEQLEQRIVLAATRSVIFDLDFTPDASTPDLQKPGAFSELFSLNYWENELQQDVNRVAKMTRVKSLLNFNGDSTLDAKDQLIAEKGIRDGIRSDFQPIRNTLSNIAMNVVIVDSAWGQLEASRNKSNFDNYAVFFGNEDRSPNIAATTNLNSINKRLNIEFKSNELGLSGVGTRVEVSSRDFGGKASPVVSVVGKTVRVEVNSNATFSTTAGEFLDAINNFGPAKQLLTASIKSGTSKTISELREVRIGRNPTTYSPVTLKYVNAEFGEATDVAPAQTNYESYAFVYGGEIVKYLIGYTGPTKNTAWDPKYFANFVVSTASHEIGHLMGLGHVVKADDSIDVSNKSSLMSYGRARWLDNATFGTQDTNYRADIVGPNELQYPFREVRKSLSGQKNTVNLIGRVPPARVHDTSEPEDFGFVEPTRVLPASSVGTVGSTTAANISGAFAAGLTAIRNDLSNALASKLNLPSSQLPLISAAISDAFGLSQKFRDAIESFDPTGLSTLSQLLTKLDDLGFVVDEAITDAELSNLRNNASNSPADFVRASKTFRLLDLNGGSSLNPAALSALGDLAGIGFSGAFDALANIAIHLTVGVDTGGFYLATGLVLDAPITFVSELSASLGSFGKVSGVGAVDMRGSILVSSSSSDGRIRIDQIASSVSSATIDGVASADLSFSANVGGQSIHLGGDWIWNVGAGSFAFDATNSGFDQDLLLDSLTELVGAGVDGFFSAANDLGNIAREIPVIGSSLSSKLTSSLASLVDLTSLELPFAERLSEAGFTFSLGAGITPRSFVDGSYITATNLLEVTYSKTYTPDIPAYHFSGSIDLGAGINGKLDGNLSINGDPTTTSDDCKIALSLGFGIDISSGPYLKEGSYIELMVSPKLAMNGELNLGKLTTITADAAAKLSLTSRVTLDDGNASTSKLFLSKLDSSRIDSIVQSKDALSVSGSAEFGLSLKAKNPAANIAFLGIGDAIKEALITPTNPNGELEWTADASISFKPVVGGFESTSLFNVTSTETYLKNISEKIKEAIFKKTFLGEVQKYNPFPSEFRKLVTSKIPFLENRSLASLTGLDALEILLADNPQSSVGSSGEVDGGKDGGAIDVKFDILDFQQISNLLSGKNANLISLVVDKSFRLTELKVPIIKETLLASYFGIVNFTGRLDLVGDVDFNVDFVAALDTDGFYIKQKADVVSITSSLGINPTLRARLTAVEFARIEGSIAFELSGGVGFTGGADGKIRNPLRPDIFTIGADLVFGLKGVVGFPEVGLSSRFDIYDRRLKLFEATYKPGSLETGANGFPEARAKMQKELNKLGLCATGVAASAFIPGVGIGVAAVACTVAYSDQIAQAWKDAGEWGGDRWEDLSDSAADAEKEVRDWANERVNVLEKEAAKLEEKARGIIRLIPGGGYVLDRFGSVANSGKDFFNAIFYGEDHYTQPTEVRVAPVFSFITPGFSQPKVLNGALVVRWNEDRDGKMHIDMLPSGQIMISSDALAPVRTLVGYEQDKKYVWVADGFNSGYRWLDDGDRRDLFAAYVHNNVYLSGENEEINRIVVIGGGKADFISVSQRTTKGVEIYGLGGNDRINGGSGGDTIFGGDGEDRISGGLGNDVIDGGDKADTIDERPGSGNRIAERNTIRAGNGNDIVYGSPGIDSIFGDQGEDQIKGGNGDDEIDGGVDADRIEGEVGNDTIRGGLGGDSLFGGSGTDKIFGGVGNDQINGGDDRDILHGEDDSDQIVGGEGNDDIFGGPSADVINGGGGNDLIFGATQGNQNDPLDGNDVIYGEGGKDTIYAGPGGIGLPNMPRGGENQNFVDGGDDDDVINGGSGPDYISGGKGNDIVYGNEGHDVIIGHEGSDVIYAGSGNDLVLGSTNAVTFLGSTIDGGSGDDLIVGSSGKDVLRGGGDKDEIHGGFRDDLIIGEGGDDKLLGDDGNDDVAGGAGNDNILGGAGQDLIHGDGDNDTLQGDGDDDRIFGDKGNDTVFWNFQDGADDIDGGSDEDNFVFSGSDQGDSIRMDHPNSVGRRGENTLIGAEVEITAVLPVELTIEFVRIEQTQLNFLAGADVLLINNLSSATSLRTVEALGGDGSDLMVIGNGDINLIPVPITLRTEAGDADRIRVIDDTNTNFVNYGISFDKVTSENALDAPATQAPRRFGGVTYDPATEFLEVHGSNERNTFRTEPSEATQYFIDGNLPAPMATCAVEGDYLELITDGTTGRRLLITKPGDGRWTFSSDHRDVVFESIERFNHVDVVAIPEPAGKGSKPRVRVFDAETKEFKFEFLAYETNYEGGVSVAVGDVNEDGLPDIVTAPGRLHAPEVRVFNGTPQSGLTGSRIAGLTISAATTYGATYTWGVNIAVGDVNGDGCNDIVTAPRRNIDNIKVFQNDVPKSGLVPFKQVRNFDAFGDLPRYIGGANVAVADLDGELDGNSRGDIIVGNGSGISGQVRVFDVALNAAAYSPKRVIRDSDTQSLFGLYVAAGDIDGNGNQEILTSGLSRGKSFVKAYSGAANGSSTPLWSHQAFTDLSLTAPAWISVNDFDFDGNDEFYVHQMEDGRNASDVRIIESSNRSRIGTISTLKSAVPDTALQLDRDLGLTSTGNYQLNWGGLNEKWIKGSNSTWYFVTPDGKLHQWFGGNASNNKVIAELRAFYYEVPELLHKAFETYSGANADFAQKLPKSTAAALDSGLVLTKGATDRFNSAGLNERWLSGNDGWYYITPLGDFYQSNVSSPSERKWLGRIDSRFNQNIGALASASVAAGLDKSLNLTLSTISQNSGGLNEKWLKGSDGKSYFITSSGKFYQSNGTKNIASSTLLQQLDADYYNALDLLAEASLL